MSDRSKLRDSDIAIIGMACRFPGANNISEFWSNICGGVESITFFGNQENIHSGHCERHIQAGAILSDVENFDAEFFGYSKREAELMDPQHRLFLECAWEAIEDAGYDFQKCSNLVGVYAGTGFNSYFINNIHLNYQFKKIRNFLGSMDDLQIMIGNDKDYLPTRLSYKLNFRGPSINVQAACATSLVAVHLACQGLLNGECEVALAGASTVLVPQKSGYLYQEGMVLSPDGHSRAFDARAQGTVLGSGVGVVLLKPLKEAVRDRDSIYAVIKGTAINNDGNMKVGFSAPSVEGQAAVILEALAVSEVESETVTYVETHGTATPLGDPIEVSALEQAFCTSKKQFCGIGSVKTNIGHLGWSSGIAGLIKTVLAIKNKKMPKSLYFDNPNPNIDFANGPFYVCTETKDWRSDELLRAGVSAFGLGGTNAHAILEETPQIACDRNSDDRNWHVLALSARNEKALSELVFEYKKYLTTNADIEISNIAYTANAGRKHFEKRFAISVQSKEEACERLAEYLKTNETNSNHMDISLSENSGVAEKKIAFLCTGAGSQYHGMAKKLYETQPTFRTFIDDCNNFLEKNYKINLKNVIFSVSEDIDDVLFLQLVLFVIGVGLAKLWISWGVNPDVVLGHSLGEYIAACIANVFSVEDALTILAIRGRLMQTLSDDTLMVAVFASREKVELTIADCLNTVSIGAENAPELVIISGEKGPVENICRKLKESKIKTRKLKVSRAGHSPAMDPILSDFEKAVSKIKLSKPSIPIISNLTGEIIGNEITTASYWVQHIRQTVEFKKGIETAVSYGVGAFIEIGPNPLLVNLGQQCVENYKVLWLTSLRSGKDDWHQLTQAICILYSNGFDIDWDGFDRDYIRYRKNLPTYRFQRKRYWIDSDNQLESAETNEIINCRSSEPSILQNYQDLQDSLYEEKWEPISIPNLTSGKPKFSTIEKVIIFCDDKEFGHQFSKQFHAISKPIIIVSSGSNFRRVSEYEFEINPHNLIDFHKFFDSLNASLCEIINLCSMNLFPLSIEISDQYPNNNAVERTWDSCSDILYLLQVIIQKKVNYSRIWIITREARGSIPSITGAGMVQSPIWGMLRVAGIEYPELKCHLIDLDSDDSGILHKNLFSILGCDIQEDRIALRKEQIYVARLMKLNPIVSSSNVPYKFKSDGCYIITGGTGGLGLLVTRWMISNGAKYIILTSRSLPGDKILSEIEQFNTLDITVKILQSDVSDAKQVENIFLEINKLNRPIYGLVHAAGIIDDGTFQQLNKENFVNTFKAKIQGAWNLHIVSRKYAGTLDFFVMFSSAASIIGTPGQANYAAANAFMDSLAYYRREQGLCGTSINWGAWLDIGGLVDNEVAVKHINRLGYKGITQSHGLKALEYAISHSVPQMGVFPMVWTHFLSQNCLEQVPYYKNFLEKVSKQDNSGKNVFFSIPQKLTQASKDEHYNILLHFVREQVAHVLSIKLTDSTGSLLKNEGPLTSYGIDSLTAIELRNNFQRNLYVSLPTTLIFDYPTVNELVKYMLTLPIADAKSKSHKIQSIPFEENNESNLSSNRNLSMQQKRWLNLIKANYGQRVVPVVFYSHLDESAFVKALHFVVERHELLRYCFPNDAIKIMPTNSVIPSTDKLFFDLSQMDSDTKTKVVGEHAKNCLIEMPNPNIRPSWAIKCLKLSQEKFSLLLSLQHLECDGSALTTFVEELRDAYFNYINNKTPGFPRAIQYYEYVEWQNHYMTNLIHEDRAYFEGMFSSMIRIPTLKAHPGFEKTVPCKSSRYTAMINLGLLEKLNAAAEKLKVTIFSLLFSAYAKWFSQTINASDVILGVITNGRSESKFKKTIGPFTAPFPIKVSVFGHTFSDLAQQCNRLIATINARSCYPVSDLVDHVPVFKKLPMDSYFSDVSINFTNYRHEKEEGLKAKVLEVLGPLSDPDFSEVNTSDLTRIPGLHLVINTIDDELCFNYWYHSERFSEEQISIWASQIDNLLNTSLDEILKLQADFVDLR